MAAKPANPNSPNIAGRVINQGMVLLRHGRLAGLMVILALIAGLTYYVYSKPVYYSKSLVKFNILDLPVHSESAEKNTPYYRLERALLLDLQQPHLIERTAVRLGLVSTTGTYATIQDQFVKSVSISKLDSYKLKIEVQPYSAEIAQVFAEAMVAEYEDYQNELRSEYREKAVETYTRELALVRKKREEKLDERIKFENDTDIGEKSIEAAEYNQLLSELYVVRQRLRAAERAAAAIDDRILDPLEKISRLALFNSEIRSDTAPTIARRESYKGTINVIPPKRETVLMETGAATANQWQSLQSKRDKLTAERTELAKDFRSGHEKMIAIDSQIALLEKQIESEAVNAELNFRTQFAQMKDTKVSLEDRLPKGRGAVADLSKNQQDLDMIETDLAWDKAYESLKSKIDYLDFGAGKERITLHYERLDQVKDIPTSPNKRKLLFASLAIGLALAFGVPMGLEHFNDTASKIDELERALNLKGLGIVPVTAAGDLEDIVRSPEVDARIPNSLLENFRVIRSGIALNSDNEKGSQVIMVTSARPSEGKTVNSCNLGWAFASLNEPTLLIDSDLRRGRVHNVLDIPNDVGLSNVLMGQMPMEEAIQPTLVPNLWALTRGPIIPGSTERLCIPEYETAVEELRTRFGRIIMDCPPVLGLSETSSLARVVDGVVLIIRAERTTQRDVQAAATALRKAGASFFGFVLNRLDLDRLSNYYNYYYYSSYYYDQMVDEEAEKSVKNRPAIIQGNRSDRPQPARRRKASVTENPNDPNELY